MNTVSGFTSPPAGKLVFEVDELIPLPAKSITYRDINLSRSTLLRAAQNRQIDTRLFRQPGSKKGRRYILRASLDAYIKRCMLDVPFTAQEAA